MGGSSGDSQQQRCSFCSLPLYLCNNDSVLPQYDRIYGSKGKGGGSDDDDDGGDDDGGDDVGGGFPSMGNMGVQSKPGDVGLVSK